VGGRHHDCTQADVVQQTEADVDGKDGKKLVLPSNQKDDKKRNLSDQAQEAEQLD
jgi:hypothetical protein